MKVFVTVGTHTQPFDRLFRALDEALEKGLEAEVVAQAGCARYRPRRFRAEAFLSEEAYRRAYEQADVVVAHAGAGTILHALFLGKPLVLVPRLQRFGEHTNDHQRELARALAARGLAVAVEEVSGLADAIRRARAAPGKKRAGESGLARALAAFLQKEAARVRREGGEPGAGGGKKGFGAPKREKA